MLIVKNIKTQHLVKQLFKIKLVVVLFFAILGASCSSVKLNRLQKQVETQLVAKSYENQFTGLLVIDANSKDTLLSKNASKYFIPASNVKILTLYTSLKLLPERIPSLKYVEAKDSIYIQGTGDPTWLHPYFKDSTVIKFLSSTKRSIALNLNNIASEKYGPGWAWEDYQYYFSPELSAVPLYGNVLTIYKKDSLVLSPYYFKSALREKSKVLRNPHENIFYIPKVLKDTLEIPFITSEGLSKTLLQKSIGKKIHLTDNLPSTNKKTLYGVPTDSILKRMLYKSDNFLAEQLMLTASSTLSDTLSFNKVRDFVLENYLNDLEQPPRWVDGSGLSRYNLFTPESVVAVLQKLYDETDKERLFNLLPAWTKNGTVGKPQPSDDLYIFAKSGSFGNTYNLSGYLKTKSGKLLIFSFMNNHFRIPSKQVRIQMEQTLSLLRNKY